MEVFNKVTPSLNGSVLDACRHWYLGTVEWWLGEMTGWMGKYIRSYGDNQRRQGSKQTKAWLNQIWERLSYGYGI